MFFESDTLCSPGTDRPVKAGEDGSVSEAEAVSELKVRVCWTVEDSENIDAVDVTSAAWFCTEVGNSSVASFIWVSSRAGIPPGDA